MILFMMFCCVPAHLIKRFQKMRFQITIDAMKRESKQLQMNRKHLIEHYN